MMRIAQNRYQVHNWLSKTLPIIAALYHAMNYEDMFLMANTHLTGRHIASTPDYNMHTSFFIS